MWSLYTFLCLENYGKSGHILSSQIIASRFKEVLLERTICLWSHLWTVGHSTPPPKYSCHFGQLLCILWLTWSHTQIWVQLTQYVSVFTTATCPLFKMHIIHGSSLASLGRNYFNLFKNCKNPLRWLSTSFSYAINPISPLGSIFISIFTSLHWYFEKIFL